MNNEENKEIKTEDVEVELTGSLVDYYLEHKVQPLPAIKKAIIKQNVAFAFEWYINQHMRINTKEAFVFSAFICLIQALPEYYGNYMEFMIEDCNVAKDDLEKILQHIRTGIIPYQIWVNKIISDIKMGGEYYSGPSVPGMVLVYLLKTMKTSIIGYMKLYKALMDDDKINDDIKEMVMAAHIYFSEMPQDLKEGYMKAFSSEDEKARRIFQDNELSLFSETLIDTLRLPLNLSKYIDIEEGKAPVFSQFWDTPLMQGGLKIVNRSRGDIEKEMAEERVKRRLPQSQGGMSNFAEYVLGYGPNGETPEEMQAKLAEAERYMAIVNGTADLDEDSANTKFVVEKVAKEGSSRVMSKNTFDTKQEAEQFVKDVTDAAPDMLKSFNFRIREEKVGE